MATPVVAYSAPYVGATYTFGGQVSGAFPNAYFGSGISFVTGVGVGLLPPTLKNYPYLYSRNTSFLIGQGSAYIYIIGSSEDYKIETTVTRDYTKPLHPSDNTRVNINRSDINGPVRSRMNKQSQYTVKKVIH